MKCNHILLFLATAAVFSACEDAFQKDVIIDVPKQPAKLVMESNTPPGGIFEVYVAQSVDILAPTNSNPFSQAFVTLYQSGNLKDTLVYNAGSDLYRAKNNTQPVQGNNYTLKATATGFTAVEASMDVPLSVPIQTLTYRPRFRNDANGSPRDEVRFTFQDAPGVANHYLVKLQVPNGFSGGSAVYRDVFCLYSTDPDAETGLTGVSIGEDNCIEGDFVMKDLRFDGRVKEVSLQVKSSNMSTVTNPTSGVVFRPRIELRAITADYYRYYKSIKLYEDAEGNPFAEPVSIYTNIKNGFGIFAAYSSSFKTVQ